MNKVILLGRLTKDPEIRYSQGAEPICVSRFTVAVDRRFRKEGEQNADFIPCVAFRRTAEWMERYIKKGMMVSLCGSMQVREYTDNAGQRRWITEVNCDEVNFGESRSAYEARTSRAGNDNYGTPMQNQGSSEPEGFSAIAQSIDEDDDLPF